jgi:hypothetical protein
VIEQHSRFRHDPEWYVDAGGETYSVLGSDSEDAAYCVAKHLGFEPSRCDLLFRSKDFSTVLGLPAGRTLVSEPARLRLEAA